MALHGGAFEHAGLSPALQLQDRDDLFHGTGRHFPPQLLGFLDEFIIVFRQGISVAGTSAFGLKAFEPSLPEGSLIPGYRFFRQAVLLRSLPAQLDPLCGVQVCIQQRSDHLETFQGGVVLPVPYKISVYVHGDYLL